MYLRAFSNVFTWFRQYLYTAIHLAPGNQARSLHQTEMLGSK